MMPALLLLALAQTYDPAQQGQAQHIRPRTFRSEGPARTSRLGQASYAFFEFAPPDGAGMGTECACFAVTGARGETVSLARNSESDCRKGGPSKVSGIAPGDVVTCAANLPRIERNPNTGNLAIETWGGPATNPWVQTALQTDALDNAAWTSTEAVTANTTLSPTNTTTADTLNDTNAGVQSCTSQTISTTSATRHQVSAYVRAGTLAKAQLKLVGTGDSAGDCTATNTSLTTTYNRLFCNSPAAYGAGVTAITVSVCVGDAASDVGTVIAFRPNHVVNIQVAELPYPSVRATNSAVSVPQEVPRATLPVAMSATAGSHAVTYTPAATAATGVQPTANLMSYDSSGRVAYSPTTAGMRTFDSTNDVSNTIAFVSGTSYRVWQDYSGSTLRLNDGSDTASGPFDGTFGASVLTSLAICFSDGAIRPAFGLCESACADPDPARCR